MPCTDPSYFCPAGRVEATPVSRGCFATSVSLPGTSSAAYFSAEAPCPVGSYCISGVRYPCFPGTYGVAPLQSGPSGCAPCPAGTFAANPGSVGALACLPCPEGTFSDVSGASFCSPCPFFTYNNRIGGNSTASCISCGSAGGFIATEITEIQASLAGARSCVSLSSATVFAANKFASVHLVVEPKGAPGSPTLLLVAIILPVAFLAALPLLYLATLRIISRGHRERVGHLLVFYTTVRSCLIRYDLYSLRHKTV